MTDLAKRVTDLEAVLRDLPMYIDNWEWARRNVDVLKTVPGIRFDQTLEINIGWMKAQNGYLVVGPSAPSWVIEAEGKT